MNSLKDEDLVKVDHINAVGVWDTVGSLGIPNQVFGGERVDCFRFTDTKLSPIVQNGFHAVSLDEQRKDFAPPSGMRGRMSHRNFFPALIRMSAVAMQSKKVKAGFFPT